MNEPRQIPRWVVDTLRKTRTNVFSAIGAALFWLVAAWYSKVPFAFWLPIGIAISLAIIALFWVIVVVTEWVYRNTGRLQISETTCVEATKRGSKYRIELTNVGYDPLPDVAIVVASIEALGEGAEHRQLKANALINRTLTIAYTDVDNGNKLPWPTKFTIGAKGNTQLIDVVHIWNRGDTYLLITDAHAKNNGGAARSSEAQLPAGDYWLRLEARNESGVLLAFTVHFGITNDTPFFRVIP